MPVNQYLTKISIGPLYICTFLYVFQMEEKKRQQDLEKEREKAEEAKMMRKIEEDQRRMKEELEKEKRKEREKQEEVRTDSAVMENKGSPAPAHIRLSSILIKLHLIHAVLLIYLSG